MQVNEDDSVPNKPGLYWARVSGIPCLVKVTGKTPFMEAIAIGVHNLNKIPLSPVRMSTVTWHGPANCPFEVG